MVRGEVMSLVKLEGAPRIRTTLSTMKVDSLQLSNIAQKQLRARSDPAQL